MGYKSFNNRHCKWCGTSFKPLYPNQQYCNEESKNCREESRKESWRKASSHYRNKYKDICFLSSYHKLGSGFLGSTPEADFTKEELAILKEKRRLRLKIINIGPVAILNLSRIFTGENFIDDAAFYLMEAYPQLLVFMVLAAFAVLFFKIFD